MNKLELHHGMFWISTELLLWVVERVGKSTNKRYQSACWHHDGADHLEFRSILFCFLIAQISAAAFAFALVVRQLKTCAIYHADVIRLVARLFHHAAFVESFEIFAGLLASYLALETAIVTRETSCLVPVLVTFVPTCCRETFVGLEAISCKNMTETNVTLLQRYTAQWLSF